MRGPRTLACATVVSGVLGLVAAADEATSREAWRIDRGEVKVSCPLTVGGSFEATTTSLSGTLALASSHPVVLSGQVVVDLTTLDTGIALRNDHLRGEYLEVGKGEGFEHATLAGIRLGDVDPDTFQGRTSFSGTFRVHGAERPVAGQAQVRRDGGLVRVEATFPVTLPDYGIPRPRYLGVGVRDTVRVQVSFLARPVRENVGGPR